MSREVWIGVLVSVALLGGAGWKLYGPFWQHEVPPPPPPPPAAAAAEPQIQYPAPAAPAPAEGEAVAPAALADSDAPMRSALSGVFGDAPVEAFLIPKNVIAGIVATVDSLDRDPIPLRTRAIAPVPGVPPVDTAGDGTLQLAPRNAKRYDVAMAALRRADGAAIAHLYLRWYPLFQQAYRELGYPQGYFNDRLVQIIDHLLAAPERRGALAVQRPKVLYVFADAELERLSSGQKILLRLGPEHAALVKAKLREIRAVIATRRKDSA